MFKRSQLSNPTLMQNQQIHCTNNSTPSTSSLPSLTKSPGRQIARQSCHSMLKNLTQAHAQLAVQNLNYNSFRTMSSLWLILVDFLALPWLMALRIIEGFGSIVSSSASSIIAGLVFDIKR